MEFQSICPLVGNGTEPEVPINGYIYTALLLPGVYLVFGLFSAVLCFLVGGTILWHQGLRERKGEIFIYGMACVYFFWAAGFASSGMYRLYIGFNGRFFCMIPRWQCLWAPHILFWLGSREGCGIMFMISGFDRVFMLSRPIQYHNCSAVYAQTMIGCGWAIFGILTILTFGRSFYYVYFETDDTVGGYCNSNHTRPVGFETAFLVFASLCVLVGFVGYVLVVFLYVNYTKNTHKSRSPQINEAQRRKHLRTTKTFVIFAGITLASVVLPAVLNILAVTTSALDGLGEGNKRLVLDLAVCMAIPYPGINMYIAIRRHREIRTGLQAFVRLKSLPQNAQFWDAQSQNNTAVRGPMKKARGIKVQPAIGQ